MLDLPAGIVLFVIAPFVGSFLGLLIIRLPGGEPVVVGRSRCRSCGIHLGIFQLIPIVSWLVQQGRCVKCSARIDSMYPIVEIAAPAIALWSFAVQDGPIVWLSCLLGWLLLAIAIIDSRHLVIPDSLNALVFTGGLASASLFSVEDMSAHVAGAVAGFVSFSSIILIYGFARHRSGMGWGDAKFLGAAGAWVSWQGLPSIVLIATLAGLMVVAAGSLMGHRISRYSRIAFGPYLCLGLWIVWLYGPIRLIALP